MMRLNPTDILSLLMTTPEGRERRSVIAKIGTQAGVMELITAFGQASDNVARQILAYILGKRHAKTAVPILAGSLYDNDPYVRAAAADALAKIGSSAAGKTLLERFIQEDDDGVRQMLAIALGAVHYRPAIEALRQGLRNPSGMLRGCVAWSLGELHAVEAIQELEEALRREEHSYAHARMQAALVQIRADGNNETIH